METDIQYEDPYHLSAKPDDLRRWIQEGKKKGAVYPSVMNPPEKARFNWLKIADVISGAIFFLIFLYPQLKWNIIPIKLFALLAQAWIIYSFLRVLVYHFYLNKSAKEVLNGKNHLPDSLEHTSSLHITNKIDLWTERVKGIISLIAFSAIGILLVFQILKGLPVGTMLFFIAGALFCFTIGIISFFAVFSFKKADKNENSEKKAGRRK